MGSDPAHARAPVPDGLCLLLCSSAPWLLGPGQAAPGPRASQAAWLPGATRPVPDPSLLSPGSATLSTPAASGLPWPPVPSALAVPEPHPICVALWLQRIGTFLQAQSPPAPLISPTCPSPAPWARAPQQGEAGALPAQPLGCSGAGLSAGPGAQACFLSSRPARAGCGPQPPPAPGLPPALLCSSPLLTRPLELGWPFLRLRKRPWHTAAPPRPPEAALPADQLAQDFPGKGSRHRVPAADQALPPRLSYLNSMVILQSPDDHFFREGDRSSEKAATCPRSHSLSWGPRRHSLPLPVLVGSWPGHRRG